MSAELVALLNERAGCSLELVGVTYTGQSGAAFVRWPDGRASVVTTALTSLQVMRQTADVLELVREAGVPVPRHDFLMEVEPRLVAVVQERMPGTTPTVADLATVTAIMDVNERFTHLLRDRPNVRPPRLSLGRPDDPIPHEPIAAQGRRASRLVEQIQTTAGQGDDMVGDDLVHVDLTVQNMLFDSAGAISGVIDWNYGVARGDRQYGLVKLFHNLSFAALAKDNGDNADNGVVPTPVALATVESRLEQVVEPTMLRRYWAHQKLNMLHSSLHWGTPHTLQLHLELGERML